MHRGHDEKHGLAHQAADAVAMRRRNRFGRIVFCSFAHADAHSEELSDPGRPCRNLLCHRLRCWHFLALAVALPRTTRTLGTPSINHQRIGRNHQPRRCHCVSLAGCGMARLDSCRNELASTRDRSSAQGQRDRVHHVHGAPGPGAAVRARDPLPFLPHSALHSEKGCKCHRRTCSRSAVLVDRQQSARSHGFSRARFVLPRI